MNKYELYHHGVLGMKWGVRRYQNVDGSLTAAGRRRYGYGDAVEAHNKRSVAKTEKRAARYVSAMERKTAKRVSKAEAKPTKANVARADRARQEEKLAKKIANSSVESKKYRAKQETDTARSIERRLKRFNFSEKKLKNLSSEQKKRLLTIAATTAAIGAISGLSYVAVKQRKQLIAAGQKYAKLNDRYETFRKLSYNAISDRDTLLDLLRDSNLSATVKGVTYWPATRPVPEWWN